MTKSYKIVVFAPETHAAILREAMGKAGAGKIGDYEHCTFSIKGVGRFRPVVGANPTIGEVGTLEAVNEERIETVCAPELLETVLAAIRVVHPYEEPATEVYEILVAK
ncbi:MAG: hypothetical protein RLZZ360_631 [Candidatus Parcubacteria bacterium]|jgi:hypothetical protein